VVPNAQHDPQVPWQCSKKYGISRIRIWFPKYSAYPIRKGYAICWAKEKKNCKKQKEQKIETKK